VTPLTLDAYQQQALETDVLPGAGEHPSTADESLMLPLLGLSGEVGQLAAQIKKRVRDRQGYTGFQSEIAEELGDALWYLAVLADRAGLRLSDIAQQNLHKAHEAFAPPDMLLRGLYDSDRPQEQQLPRQLTVRFEEGHTEHHGVTVPTVVVHVLGADGEVLGDPLDDNRSTEDDYRYHDVFHLAYLAVLGWSPVMRAVLRPKRKRRGDQADRIQDGGRAIAIEEGLTAAVFSEARLHTYFASADRVPGDLIKLCQRMTSHLEVADRSGAQWQAAILAGYRVFHQLREHRGGTVVADMNTGTLEFMHL
jgi:NTP pyrophosphatase (non-canonical NTP hydrolase)